MATAAKRTKTVTRMEPVEFKVADGVDLHLTEEEAFLIAVLVGCCSGGHPLRESVDSIYGALNKVLGVPRRKNGSYRSVLHRAEYHATLEAFEQRPSARLKQAALDSSWPQGAVSGTRLAL